MRERHGSDITVTQSTLKAHACGPACRDNFNDFFVTSDIAHVNDPKAL